MAAPRNDVVDLLVQQHARVRDLFDEIAEGEGDARREAFGQLVRLLAVHETAEEEVVHPAARASLPGGAGVIEDRLTEERLAKEQLAALEEMGVDDPRFDAELDKLRIAVLTHARSEERYEFRLLGDELGDKQHRALTAAVKAAEATAPTHPHPGTESATKNLLVGPLAAMADRVRDIIDKAG